MSDEETYDIPSTEFRPAVFGNQQSHGQSAGQYSQPKETYYNPYPPVQENPYGVNHAPQRQYNKQGGVTVDTSSIIGKGITPSAVARGVATGQDDALSKYRITKEDDNRDVDWIKEIRSASRAQVEDNDTAYVSGEPAYVHAPNAQHKPGTTNVQHHQPPPSQQLRRDDNVFSRPNNNSAVNANRPNNQRNPAPPPGPSRAPQYQQYPPPSTHQQYQNYPPSSSHQQYQNYPPPSSQQQYGNYPPSSSHHQHHQQQRSHDPNPWVKEESTIKPSVLRDSSDPLEKYKIKDTPPETLQNPVISSSGNQPKSLFKDNNDVLDKYRVKSAEEEEKTWHIYLIGLTADPGKPIELKCDGQVVYAGEGVNGHVTTHVTYESKGAGPTSIILNIKSLNFVLNKSLELQNGRFVRFGVERGQLKFRQQKTDVVD
jgi:hypothetical protein